MKLVRKNFGSNLKKEIINTRRKKLQLCLKAEIKILYTKFERGGKSVKLISCNAKL